MPAVPRRPTRGGGPQGGGGDGGPGEPSPHREEGDGRAHTRQGHPPGRALRLPHALPITGTLHPGGAGAPDLGLLPPPGASGGRTPLDLRDPQRPPRPRRARNLPARPLVASTARMEFEGLDEAALEALAASVADFLEPGDVVVLSGEVGSGKTTFVRAAARSLGVEQRVTSPTYQIARGYGGTVDGREVTVNHL